MSKYYKLWRESTSIIPLVQRSAAAKQIMPSTFNYDLLVEKRSHKSTHLPNSIVFPGGVFETQDASLEWIDHLRSFNICNDKFDIFRKKKGWETPIFQGNNEDINRHISLRISAIRELFEELGILVCHRDGKQANQRQWANVISDFDIKEWQQRVTENPEEFLNLCRHLKCYPDIWSLYFWCEWLTPIGFYSKRYNTAFFLIFFESQPTTSIHVPEISEVSMLSPYDILKRFYEEKLFLPPPQAYELGRIRNLEKIEDAMKFVADGNPQCSELIFPMIALCKDGPVGLFQGDELYPKEPNLLEFDRGYEEMAEAIKDKTTVELMNEAKIAHRSLQIGQRPSIFIKNYKPMGNHIFFTSAKLEDYENAVVTDSSKSGPR